MEELQTTEILDREILEDARKKAYRILKAADDAVKAQAGEWERKSAAALAGLRKNEAERRAHAAAEVMARLPMDKRRAKAEKLESLLQQAEGAWYKSLGRERVLSILKTELAWRIKKLTEEELTTDLTNHTDLSFDSSFFCSRGSWLNSKMTVTIHKLGRNEAETILKDLLPGCACEIAEMPSVALYPEIVLENNAVRVTASLHKTVDFFLHEKRAELAQALLGNAALPGEDALC